MSFNEIIIPQYANIVNIKDKRLIGAEKKYKKMSARKKTSVIIGEKLCSIGEYKRGQFMLACNQKIQFTLDENCKAHITNAHLCRDRLCPTCSHLLSIKRYNEMVRCLEYIGPSKYDWRFVTLTIKNCRVDELKETISQMLKAWDKLNKRRGVKKILCGWARSLEVTYNDNTGTFHPHLHVLCAFEKNCAPNYLEVRQVWADAMELKYTPICDIIAPYVKNSKWDTYKSAIVEAFKYCVKSKNVVDMPLYAFKCLVDGIKNKQMIAYSGIIKNARKQLKLNNKDVPDRVVDDISDKEVKTLILEWSFAETKYIIFGARNNDTTK